MEDEQHIYEDGEGDDGETPCGSAPQKKELVAAKGEKAVGRRACQKCNTVPSIFMWRKEYICWGCYRNLFEKRFKTNFVRGRKTKREHVRLLLAFSGGPSSRALLHNVAQCTMGRGTKVLYEVQVLHIDQSRVTGISDADREEQHERLRAVVEGYGLRLDIVPLETVASSVDSLQKRHEPKEQEKPVVGGVVVGVEVEPLQGELDGEVADSLQRLFDRTTTLTSREDLLVYLRTRLLASLATQRGSSWVCVGDSATRIAVDMIADTCKGRAYGLPERLSFIDTRYPNLLWVRPMKEFLAQEIAIYNHFAKLPTVFIPQLDTKAPKMASINHLTEAFLAGLQADFPQTVHTLLRSGDKLCLPAPLPTDSRHSCPLCNSALTPDEVKAAVSHAGKAGVKGEEESEGGGGSCCGGGGSCGGVGPNITGGSCDSGGCGTSGSGAALGDRAVEVAGLVCYGCRKLLAESEPALLPPYVRHQALALSRSLRLREEIRGFLLDDNDDEEEEDEATDISRDPI